MVEGVICIPIPGERKHPPGVARADFDLPSFVCGPENRLAQVVVERVLAFAAGRYEPTTDSTSRRNNGDHHPHFSIPNPLVFTGPTGCGKTHIIQGLVTQWQARFGNNAALCTTAVDFARRLTQADDAVVRREIRKAFRTRSLLAIDDLENLPGRRTVGEELVNTIDAVDRQGGLVLVTSNEPPGRLPNLLPALRSRLGQGLLLPLTLPGRAARREITRRVSKRRGMTLSKTEIDAIADSAERSPRTIAHRLAHWQFARLHHSENRPIDPTHLIAQPIDASNRSSAPSLRTITSVVARYFSLRQSEIRGKSRRQSIVYARGVAMYLARELTDRSLAKVGAEFGGRDHTTVLHACRKTADLIAYDAETRSIVATLRRILICD